VPRIGYPCFRASRLPLLTACDRSVTPVRYHFNSNIYSCTTKSMKESLEKLMVAQLVNRSPGSYRIRKCTDAARTYPEARPDATSVLSSHSQNVHILLLRTDVCQFGSIAFMCREFMVITHLPSQRQTTSLIIKKKMENLPKCNYRIP
jgi:hypothetical protein